MSDYQPDFDLDKVRGQEGEELVRKMRSAILVGTCEVKTDDRAHETGNVYIEYSCRTAVGWRPSGIAATKATSWAFVLDRTVVWMPVWLLKQVAREKGTKRESIAGSHPTKGVTVKVADLVPHSMAVVHRDVSEAA